MVKYEKTAQAPKSLAIEKAKGSHGKYNCPDVTELLWADFHHKCYICELKDLPDPEVEHLTSHKGDLNLKFDWNNLFLSCPHCNGVKNRNIYDGKVIDCCKEDPEAHMSCLYGNGDVHITAKDDWEISEKTARLISQCCQPNLYGVNTYILLCCSYKEECG